MRPSQRLQSSLSGPARTYTVLVQLRLGARRPYCPVRGHERASTLTESSWLRRAKASIQLDSTTFWFVETCARGLCVERDAKRSLVHSPFRQSTDR